MTSKQRGPRVLVVYKKSAFEIYVRERNNTRVQELLAAGDAAVANLKRAHEDHRRAMEDARAALQRLGARATFRYRSGPVSMDEFDMVVTLGGDGTLLWASNLTGPDCPVLAINTAPRDSVGHFCAGTTENVDELLVAGLNGQLPATRLSRMRVAIDEEVVSTRVLNDILFSHACPAATTRFGLRVAGEHYTYKCSGLWVGTPAGSTAALLSAGGRPMAIGSKRLQFVVRELYRGGGQTGLPPSRGFIDPGQQLVITNHIRAGRLFVDGPHQKRSVDIGSRVSISLSDEPLTLLGFDRHRGRSSETPVHNGG